MSVNSRASSGRPTRPRARSLAARLTAVSLVGAVLTLLVSLLRRGSLGSHAAVITILLQAGILAVTALTVALVAGRHTRELRGISAALRQAVDGDLTAALPAQRDVDLHELAGRARGVLDLLQGSMAMLSGGSAALNAGARELQDLSMTMSSTAEATAGRAAAVSVSAEQVSGSAHRVAAATEQFNATIRDIAVHASDASSVAQAAALQAGLTNEAVSALSAASQRVTQVVDLISNIARQTHLLALNATLEAARAGEAGRGFAVVASEVKQLAEQTAAATGSVSETVRGMQEGATDVARAIADITTTIGRVSGNQTAIASAVEEQTATTSEIGNGATQAANDASNIVDNVTALSNAARATAYAGAQSRTTAAEFANLADSFKGFTANYRFATTAVDVAATAARVVARQAVTEGSVTRIEDTVEGTGLHEFSFHGEWRHSTGNIEADGTNSYSCNTGDVAVLRFRGTAVAFFGVTDANHGRVGLSIDGGQEIVVDEYSASRAAGVRLWSSARLTPGEHALTIRVTGESHPDSRFSWAAIDRVDVS